MLLKKACTWLFTRTSLKKLFVSRQQKPANSVSRASLYRRCSDTPMRVFLLCLCDEQFEALVIDGKPTQDELMEAWVLLLSEYQELRGDSVDSVEQIRLAKEIHKLRSHLQLVEYCLQFLAVGYSESIAGSLRELGYTFKPAEPIPSLYIDQLNKVANKTKLKYVQLQQMVKQLAEELKKGQSEKATRDQFESTLIHIEEMQKTTYDLDTITVSKYVMLEKKLQKQIELYENKKKWQPSV